MALEKRRADLTLPAELRALAERVEAGSGFDHRLDNDIAVVLGWQYRDASDRGPAGWINPKGSYYYAQLPGWHTSLDAVVALIAERLPERAWEIGTAEITGPTFWARVGLHWQNLTDATSPARALLAAFLRALDALAQHTPEAHQNNGESDG